MTARAMLCNHALGLAEEIDALGAAARPPAVEVVIPGTPVAKARARAGLHGHYTPAKTENAEAWAKACIVQQVGRPMLTGPLALHIECVQPVPASWSKRKQAAALCGALHPTGRPDLDNLAKLVCDAGNELLWRDDSQVVRASFVKRYGDAPQTVVRVQPLNLSQGIA